MKKLLNTSRGAALVEYGLLVGLIAVLAIVAVIGLGSTTRDTFCEVSSTVGEQIFGTSQDCLTADAGEPAPAPAPVVPDIRCLSPANVGVIAGADWDVCANMLIVDDTLIRAAASPFAGGDGSYDIVGPDTATYTFGNGPQTIYTGQVTNMASLFSGSAFNDDISHWDMQSVNATNSMFASTTAFNQPIGDWNMSSVTQMDSMFFRADAFNQPIGDWDVAGANISNMFYEAEAFNQNINDWDVSQNTAFQNMFRGTLAYNQPLDGWDMSSAANIQTMFFGAVSFNQPLGSWQLTSLDNNPNVAVAGTFQNASAFNQDLSTWCVPTVASPGSNFDTNAVSWAQARPVWGTCP